MATIQFGFCVPIFAQPGVALFRTPNYAALDAATTMRLAVQAEALGYDSLWVADHLMLGKDEAILEGWTVIAALAGATNRAKLGMIHQANLFRHPALAAKMAATLDQISGGRLIHFVDCGHARREHVAYGLPWSDDAATRVAQLVDGVKVTLALWTAEAPVTYDGPHYRLREAVCTPRPRQQPHPPIWFGETNPGILDACARYGQGWNTVPVSLDELRRRLALLAAACERVGRPCAEIEKSLEIQILIAQDVATLRQRFKEMLALAPAEQTPDPELLAFVNGDTDRLPDQIAETWIVGTPDQVEARLRAYIAEGIGHVMLWFVDAPRDDGLRLFAEKLRPRFR